MTEKNFKPYYFQRTGIFNDRLHNLWMPIILAFWKYKKNTYRRHTLQNIDVILETKFWIMIHYANFDPFGKMQLIRSLGQINPSSINGSIFLAVEDNISNIWRF